MTNAEKIAYLLNAPWTVYSEAGVDGTYMLLRIKELPEFLVTGTDPQDMVKEFWLALESLLTSYVDEADDVPVPTEFRSMWQLLTADDLPVAATPVSESSTPTTGASLVPAAQPEFAMAS